MVAKCLCMLMPYHVPVCSTLELDPKNGVDLASQSHTELPVPAELTVKPSGIPGAGLGVFANVFIPVGVEMGPYEGKVVEGEGIGEIDSAAYAWEVRCSQCLSVYLCAKIRQIRGCAKAKLTIAHVTFV